MKESVKKKLVILAAVLLVVVVAAAAVILCKTKKPASDEPGPDNQVTEKPEPGKQGSDNEVTEKPDKPVPTEVPVEEPEGVKTIRFAIPAFGRDEVYDDYIRKFNNALWRDGYKYKLQVVMLDFMNYTEEVRKNLQQGKIDVAMVGFNDRGNNNVYNLIRDGLVINLDEILTKGKGQVIYNAFPAKLWEAVKCDGHICSIPSVPVYEENVFVAFNNQYLSADAIENWDGTLQGVYEIIKDVEWNDVVNPRFQYNMSSYDFMQMLRSELRYGLLFDYDTKTVENPLESEKFLSFLKALDQIHADHFMSTRYTDSTEYFNFLMAPGTNDAGVLKRIEEGKYLATLSTGSPDELFLKDTITVKSLKAYLGSRAWTSIGISAKTDDVDAVVDFLSLLYGDGKYANILLYGLEGIDYKLVDGVVYNLDGSVHIRDDIFTKIFMDLYINAHPISGESFMKDRKNQIFAYYDNMELSPFIGFQVDTSKINGKIEDDLDDFVKRLTVTGDSWEDILDASRAKLKEDGIDEALEDVRKQWEAFRE